MKLTWSIAVCCTWALLTLGLVMMYSVDVGQGDGDIFLRQLHWLAVGLVAFLVALCPDYRWLNRHRIPWLLYGLAVALLALVLVPGLGSQINGARRWLFGVQPSEFAKIAYVIFLAHYCAAHQSQMQRRNEGFLHPAALIALVVGLIFIEPDWGTAVLVAMVGGIFLTVAGTRKEWLVAAAMVGVEVLVLALCHDAHRLERVLAFRDPEAFRETIGWQPWNALLALGSGGVTGLGLGEGRLKLGFIPEHHTDFILAVIGEELGLVGASAVLGLFVTLVLCGWRIAWRAPDGFGQYLAMGLTFLIGWQALINLGVATSSLPNKGIPLPLVSYGGSSLVSTLFGLGLLLNIGRHVPPRMAVQPPPAAPKRPEY